MINFVLLVLLAVSLTSGHVEGTVQRDCSVSCADLLVQRRKAALPYLVHDPNGDHEPSAQDALEFENILADIQHLEHKTRHHGLEQPGPEAFYHTAQDDILVAERSCCSLKGQDPWSVKLHPEEEEEEEKGDDDNDDDGDVDHADADDTTEFLQEMNGRRASLDEDDDESSSDTVPAWLRTHLPPPASRTAKEIIVDEDTTAIPAFPRKDPRDDKLRGIMETHAHVFSHLTFGARFLYGRPEGPLAKSQRKCSGMSDHGFPIYGGHGLDTALACTPWGVRTHFKNKGRLGYVDGSDNGDDFYTWPANVAEAHQQMHVNHIYKAYQKGLRGMVVTAVNNELICLLTSALRVGFPGKYGVHNDDCTDYTAIKRTAHAMHNMANKHQSWMEIAKTADDFHRIVSAGKLAIVLAIETSDPFIDTYHSEDKMNRLLAEYRADGYRIFQIVHEFNNAFSGAAYHQPLLETGTNLLHTIHKVQAALGSAKRLKDMRGQGLGDVDGAKLKLREIRRYIRDGTPHPDAEAEEGGVEESRALWHKELQEAHAALKEERVELKEWRQEQRPLARDAYKQDTKNVKKWRQEQRGIKKAQKEADKAAEKERWANLPREAKRKERWAKVGNTFKTIGKTFWGLTKAVAALAVCPARQLYKIHRVIHLLRTPLFRRPRDQMTINKKTGYGNIGLKPAGKKLVRALMKNGLLFDTAHMSPEAIKDAYEISKNEFNHYPMWSSHGAVKGVNDFRDSGNSWDAMPEVLEAIMKTGGTFGLRPQGQTAKQVPGTRIRDCPGTATGPANAIELLHAVGATRTGITLGTDLNGWAPNVAGRFNPHYINKCQAFGGQPGPRLNTRYDIHGLARIDALPDFVQDVTNFGTRGSEALTRSVHDFYKMWKRSEDPTLRTGPIPGTKSAEEIRAIIASMKPAHPDRKESTLHESSGLDKELHPDGGAH